MFNRINFILQAGVTLGLILNSCFAEAITTTVIKKETADYILDIKYPQDFKSPMINSTLNDFIVNIQKSFMSELSEDADTPVDAPGKTGLNITYSIPYQTKNALSVRFNISIFHRGAAHPFNTIAVENFVNGNEVKLNDLFLPGSNYLKPIANFSEKKISAQKSLDERWIKDGTKPTSENYSVWNFTPKGLSIIFNSYQVAAYVYGEQEVAIPLSLISNLVKPDLVKTVWGN